MVTGDTITVQPSLAAAVRWRQILDVTYPDANRHKGYCTHEDVAFLIDPMHVIGDEVQWAKTTFKSELEASYGPSKLLRLKMYVSYEPILWGAGTWPALRVESWHTSSSITLILALAIGLVAAVGIFLHWLFKKAEEIKWVVPIIGLGLIAVTVTGIWFLSKKDKD